MVSAQAWWRVASGQVKVSLLAVIARVSAEVTSPRRMAGTLCCWSRSNAAALFFRSDAHDDAGLAFVEESGDGGGES